MTLVAWFRYHVFGRNKRGRTLNVIVLISFSLLMLSLQGRRRSTTESTFVWPDFDFYIREGLLRNDKVRVLPFTGGSLTADWIYNTTSGSFWLPHPPSNPISGYESRTEGNTFQTNYFKGRSGFMHPDKIDIVMAQSTAFNAGDFYSLWIAPMVAGRMPNLPSDGKTNRCSLQVVGSILSWGIRYVWGPGFIDSTKELARETEHVFALRGPNSYEMAKKSPYAETQSVSPVYGDPGLLMSWYYQPHNQTKSYNLCLIPHYAESRASQLVDIENRFNGRVLQIDMMMDPIFQIMDNIVKCEFILSSSLHGIIFADSYGVPNAHMKLSGRVTGGNYKFDDYFLAVNRTRSTLDLTNRTSVDMDDIKSIMDKNREPADIDLMGLWNNAPMHAQAYNRSREEHVEFARNYVKRFTDTLDNKPINLNAFLDQMGIEH